MCVVNPALLEAASPDLRWAYGSAEMGVLRRGYAMPTCPGLSKAYGAFLADVAVILLGDCAAL